MILRTTIGAFLCGKESTAAVEALKAEPIFLRSEFDIHDGGIEAAVSHLANTATPPLVIVETKAQGDALYSQLGDLADVCSPNTHVILVGTQNDIVLYRNLLSEGICDYLVSPVDSGQLKTSIENAFKDENDEKNGRSIAFFGITGGVGSSVVSHNVAYELLKEYKQNVIVIDLDIPYGTAALNYNFQPRQSLVDVLSQVSRLDESFLEQYLMEYEDKLTILSSPSALTTGMQVTPESIVKVVKYARLMADFVILDVPHVWAPWVNDVLVSADDVVLMARPDLTNLRNAKNVMELLGTERGTQSPTRLVLNQAGAAKRSDLLASDFKDALAIEPSLSIPYDPEAFGRALNNGEMMSKASAKSKATEMIVELAKVVSGRIVENEDNKKGIMSLFRKDNKDKKD